MNAVDIELFKNLSEWDLDETYRDLHNDFECIAIEFENTRLSLVFKERSELDSLMSLVCENTKLIRFDLKIGELLEALTLDNFYRGRCESDTQLLTEEEGRGYFYLEFYEGPRFEFWCEQVSMVAIQRPSMGFRLA